jgi:predicted MPP superfamily phosphohydrolase
MTILLPEGRLQPPAAPKLTRRGFIRSGLGLAGFAGVLTPSTTAYAAAEAAQALTVTHYRLRPPSWPPGQRLAITVVADLHAGGPNMGAARIAQVVDAANALNGDLVVLLGDFFATHAFVTERVPHPVWAGELARLRAPLGVHAILGNHDWWYDVAGVRAALARVRIPVMENDAVLLGDASHRFWLAGLGDQVAYRLGHGKFRGVDDLPATLSHVTTDDPLILLVHEPDIFTEVPARVAHTLAVHTHGGQIRLPDVPPVWTPSAYGARFAYGHIVEDNRHMIVSAGLGCSVAPLRLGMPPEIVRIELG